MTTGNLTVDELKADYPQLVAELVAEARKEFDAKNPKPETPEEAHARKVREVEEKVLKRTLAICAACKDVDRLDLALGYIQSDKAIEVIESELARYAGRLH